MKRSDLTQKWCVPDYSTQQLSAVNDVPSDSVFAPANSQTAGGSDEKDGYKPSNPSLYTNASTTLGVPAMAIFAAVLLVTLASSPSFSWDQSLPASSLPQLQKPVSTKSDVCRPEAYSHQTANIPMGSTSYVLNHVDGGPSTSVYRS